MRRFCVILWVVFMVLLTIYMCGYWCFFGGIVQLFNGLGMTPFDSKSIAMGVLKILAVMPLFWINILATYLVLSFFEEKKEFQD